MSVIFSVGKKSANIVKGKDRSAARRRMEGTASTGNLPTEIPTRVYDPSVDTVVWNTKVAGSLQSLVFTKSTMSIWLENEKLEYVARVDSNSTMFDFSLLGKPARIIRRLDPSQSLSSFELLIEGKTVS
nr:unnamed protein product [Spirometra erinaceieuropaei]